MNRARQVAVLGKLAAFSPRQVAGLTVWLDPLVGVYQSAGGAVSGDGDAAGYWMDQSGNGNHMAQTEGARTPVFASSGVNSKPSLTFTSDFMKCANFASALTQPFTVIVVTQPTALSSVTVVWGSGNNYTSTFDGAYWLANWGAAAQCSTGVPTTDPVIHSLIVNGASSSVFLNGTAQTTGNPGANTMVNFQLGAYGNETTYPYQGHIGDALVYSGALSTTNRNNIEKFLGLKYGITVA